MTDHVIAAGGVAAAPPAAPHRVGFFAHHGIWAPGVRLFRGVNFAAKALIISLSFMLPMLGLPPDFSGNLRPAGGGDHKEPGNFDAPASKTADVDADLVAQFRRHLRTCSKLPASVSRADDVKVTLRVQMTREGRLANEPALIEGSASMKGPLLLRSAINALEACQPYGMLPADRYDEWKVIDLSFTPQDFS